MSKPVRQPEDVCVMLDELSEGHQLAGTTQHDIAVPASFAYPHAKVEMNKVKIL